MGVQSAVEPQRGKAGVMRFGSLFAGIGGFDLGLERSGMECAWQVEIDDYCNKVLAKHWPGVKRYGDIRTIGKRELEPVDLICGGFPCQPYSVAGKRRGEDDDRNLWPEFLRIVREVRPAWVLGENVPGIVPLYLDTVLSDLEGEGYTCWTFNIPACAVDAPHRRERIWVVAYGECVGREARPVLASLQSEIEVTEGQDIEQLREVVAYAEGEQGRRVQQGGFQSDIGAVGKDVSDTEPERLERNVIEEMAGKGNGRSNSSPARSDWWTVEPNVGRVAHGVPARVDRLRALGNAVVPQVVEFIGRQILATHERRE